MTAAGVGSDYGQKRARLVRSGRAHEGMTGLFFCDAGYLKKAGDLSKLSESGIIICAATRKNMKRLMSLKQRDILRRRNVIESGWGVLKQNFFIGYHQSRSLRGLFRHYICGIVAYMLDFP